MQRRSGLTLLATLALTACGFELRRAPVLAFKSIYAGFAEASGLGNEFKRAISASGQVRVVRDLREINTADVVMEVLQDQREKTVVALNSAGQVLEFQLRLRLRFRLRTPAGKELLPETEILQQRELSFNESAVLSKDAEELLLYRDMQSDIVQQLLRRLAAVREL
jgi:LPS-assembly lipoprotein